MKTPTNHLHKVMITICRPEMVCIHWYICMHSCFNIFVRLSSLFNLSQKSKFYNILDLLHKNQRKLKALLGFKHTVWLSPHKTVRKPLRYATGILFCTFDILNREKMHYMYLELKLCNISCCWVFLDTKWSYHFLRMRQHGFVWYPTERLGPQRERHRQRKGDRK